jgi:hypothetical protein
MVVDDDVGSDGEDQITGNRYYNPQVNVTGTGI